MLVQELQMTRPVDGKRYLDKDKDEVEDEVEVDRESLGACLAGETPLSTFNMLPLPMNRWRAAVDDSTGHSHFTTSHLSFIAIVRHSWLLEPCQLGYEAVC
jgi:hypothetical protein